VGKLWKVNIYTVPPDKSNEHDDIVKQMIKICQQTTPNIQFLYFRKRFGPFNGRIMILAGYDSFSDWEHWMTVNKFPKQLVKDFYATLNQDSWDNVFWEEIPTE
jgi:hypothetical protein